MPCPIPYALFAPALLGDVVALLSAELPAELAATQAAVPGVTLPPPVEIRSGHFEATRDRLPLVTAHIMSARQSVVDSMGADLLETTLRVYVLLGEGELGTIDESGYSAGQHAYMGAISGLLQRRLPQVAYQSSAVYETAFSDQRWEPAVDEVAGLWIQQGRLDLVVRQSVTFAKPTVPVYEAGVFEPGVFT